MSEGGVLSFSHKLLACRPRDFRLRLEQLKREGNCQFFRSLKTTLKTNKYSRICYFGTPAEQWCVRF